MEKPKLRTDIQVTPYQDAENVGVLIQDALIEGRTMMLSDGAVLLMSFMDGTRTIRDIQSEIMRQTGQLVNSEEIEQFVQLLDNHYLLDNANYRQRLRTLAAEYKRLEARPPLMADAGYPADPQQLRAFLDDVFAQSENSHLDGRLPEKLSGIVAPHIDIPRGQNTYAKVYGALRKYDPAQTYIVLGVNHQYPTQNPFIATDRAYQTPLGKLPVDTGLLHQLNQRLDWDILEGEIAHRGEHSIEFPALFLRYLYPEAEMKIVPILSNYYDKTDERVERFIRALREIIAGREDIVLISSVDFSHIGPQFGWQREVTPADIASTEREDRLTIAFLEKNDPDGFYADIMKDQNRRNIDALGATYVFQRVLDKPGVLIQYEQAFDPLNTVTFTGLIF